MHKANTYYDEEQPYLVENSNQHHIENAPTETEKKALNFFDTSIEIDSLIIKKIFSFQVIQRDLFYILKLHFLGFVAWKNLMNSMDNQYVQIIIHMIIQVIEEV